MTSRIDSGEDALSRKLSAFAPLGRDDLARLSQLRGARRYVKARQTLIREGHDRHRAYLLLDGWTYSYRLLPDGGRQVIGFQIPGDFIGLGGLWLGTSTMSFDTITDAIICEISPDALADIFEKAPRLSSALLWAASRDEATITEHLIDIGRRSALTRTAHLLLELGQRLKLVGRGTDNGYRCPLSQYLLADALGLSAIHLNRVLRQLREARLLRLHGGTLLFLDLHGLRDLADYDGSYLDPAPAPEPASSFSHHAHRPRRAMLHDIERSNGAAS